MSKTPEKWTSLEKVEAQLAAARSYVTQMVELRNTFKASLKPSRDEKSAAAQARYAEAAQLRSDGKTYRQIGAALGVTSGRARQLVLHAEKATRIDEMFDGSLSVRTENCLARFYGVTPNNITPEMIIGSVDKIDELLATPNFGSKCAKEIRKVAAYLEERR